MRNHINKIVADAQDDIKSGAKDSKTLREKAIAEVVDDVKEDQKALEVNIIKRIDKNVNGPKDV